MFRAYPVNADTHYMWCGESCGQGLVGLPVVAVCANRIGALGPMDPQAIQQIRLPHSRAMAFLVDEGNKQGLISMLKGMGDDSQAWAWLLCDRELANIPALLDLLAKSRKEEEEAEEDRLIDASLAEEKLEEFRRNVMDARQRFGRLRPLLGRFGMVRNFKACLSGWRTQPPRVDRRVLGRRIRHTTCSGCLR